MPLTLKQAREKQERAKELIDSSSDKEERRKYMADLTWLSGYMAAMIDWGTETRIEKVENNVCLSQEL